MKLKHFLFYATSGLLGEQPAPPTALQLAVQELEQSQVELLHHKRLMENEQGNVKILEGRIKRLQLDIQTLATAQEQKQ